MQPISLELSVQAMLLSDVRARMAAAGPAPAGPEGAQAPAASPDVILTLSSAAQQLKSA